MIQMSGLGTWETLHTHCLDQSTPPSSLNCFLEEMSPTITRSISSALMVHSYLKFSQARAHHSLLEKCFLTISHYIQHISLSAALTRVDITLKSNETTFSLQFDLAIDALTCDTTQFSFQTSDGAVTFRPTIRTECEQVDTLYYDEDNTGNNIHFTLHPSDHIQLHSTGIFFSEAVSVFVSVGSSFVKTAGLTGIIPLYFIDKLTAGIEINTGPELYPLVVELDMTRAEFHVVFNIPVNSNESQIELFCEEADSVIIEGLWSTPVPDINSTTRVSMRIAPHSFATLCSTLFCIRDGYAILQDIYPLTDVFGNIIGSTSLTYTTVSGNTYIL